MTENKKLNGSTEMNSNKKNVMQNPTIPDEAWDMYAWSTTDQGVCIAEEEQRGKDMTDMDIIYMDYNNDSGYDDVDVDAALKEMHEEFEDILADDEDDEASAIAPESVSELEQVKEEESEEEACVTDSKGDTQDSAAPVDAYGRFGRIIDDIYNAKNVVDRYARLAHIEDEVREKGCMQEWENAIAKRSEDEEQKAEVEDKFFLSKYDDVLDALEDVEQSLRQSVMEKLKVRVAHLRKAVSINKEIATAGDWVKEVNKRMKARAEKKRASEGRYTAFHGAPFKNCACGEYEANDTGISAPNQYGHYEKICDTPIFPVREIADIKTGDRSLEIAYFIDGKWETKIFPLDAITDPNKMGGLLINAGIRAIRQKRKLTELSTYLAMRCNPGRRTDYTTVHLGWYGDVFVLPGRVLGESKKHITFDVLEGFRDIGRVIQSKGDLETWLNAMRACRAVWPVAVRIYAAATFAAPIVPLLGLGQCPVVDLYGTTGNGKTVVLELMASAWGVPGTDDGYVDLWDGTKISREAKCAVLGNIPYFLDETKILETKGKYAIDGAASTIYEFSGGRGRARSNTRITLQDVKTWATCMITGGEHELSGIIGRHAGAKNRILEFLVDEIIFDEEEAASVMSIANENHGLAGPAFVEILQRLGKDEVKAIYEARLKEMRGAGSAKQEVAMAMLLTADQIATQYLFKDGVHIFESEARQYIQKDDEISDDQSCYDKLMDWAFSNYDQHFKMQGSGYGELWGELDEEAGILWILPSVLEKFCLESGTTKKVFLGWCDKKGLIGKRESDSKAGRRDRYQIQKRMHNRAPRYFYKLKIDLDDGNKSTPCLAKPEQMSFTTEPDNGSSRWGRWDGHDVRW